MGGPGPGVTPHSSGGEAPLAAGRRQEEKRLGRSLSIFSSVVGLQRQGDSEHWREEASLGRPPTMSPTVPSLYQTLCICYSASPPPGYVWPGQWPSACTRPLWFWRTSQGWAMVLAATSHCTSSIHWQDTKHVSHCPSIPLTGTGRTCGPVTPDWSPLWEYACTTRFCQNGQQCGTVGASCLAYHLPRG
jgi:hypothetical protein